MNKRSLTILVVEDETKLQDLAKRVLTRSGYDVVQAFDGAGLHLALALGRPNLIVLDAMLPDSSGLELLARLKRDPETHAIPVLVWSGFAAESERQRALDLGAEDFIEKGSPIELASRIDAVLAGLGGSDTAA